MTVLRVERLGGVGGVDSATVCCEDMIDWALTKLFVSC